MGRVKRSSPLKRSSQLRRRKPVKAVNAQRKSKREAAYRKYLGSPAWKVKRAEAMERAGHRCEYRGFSTIAWRCAETERLETHHLRYPKELGTEPITDLLVCCKAHHQAIENLKWWRRR